MSAEPFLRDEGFTEVQYITRDGVGEHEVVLASGEANISMALAPTAIIRLGAGDPIVFLGGGHIGCFELFGSERVRTVRDLKGKTVRSKQVPTISSPNPSTSSNCH